jgi:hypothetical protein
LRDERANGNAPRIVTLLRASQWSERCREHC